jgi:hypothetical protein
MTDQLQPGMRELPSALDVRILQTANGRTDPATVERPLARLADDPLIQTHGVWLGPSAVLATALERNIGLFLWDAGRLDRSTDSDQELWPVKRDRDPSALVELWPQGT